MFAGIIEGLAHVREVVPGAESLRLIFEKPSNFNDLSIGDSVCVDGVCLTLEVQNAEKIEFVAAAETLQITNWNRENVLSRAFNLERSLRWGDRVHGHLVTGHVDSLARVEAVRRTEESLFLEIAVPEALRRYVWKKGCVAINGVSLTVNDVVGDKVDGRLTVCLIPETLRRTNLANLQVGDFVNMEADYFAKGLLAARSVELREGAR